MSNCLWSFDTIKMSELKAKCQSKIAKEQYELYVQFIEDNLEMVTKKDSDQTIQDLWDRLTHLLNAIAGPQRCKENWKKIFENWRNSLRYKKRKEIININATGGGPESGEHLRPIEERAVCAWGAVVLEGISEANATTAEPVAGYSTDDLSLPRHKGTRKRKTVSDGAQRPE